MTIGCRLFVGFLIAQTLRLVTLAGPIGDRVDVGLYHKKSSRRCRPGRVEDLRRLSAIIQAGVRYTLSARFMHAIY